MTRVCHMTSVHNSQDVRIFRKECVSLANAGYEVYLVAQGDSFEREGVKIVGVPVNDGGRLNRIVYKAKEVYKKALELDADIYHFHDPELLPYGLKLKKKGKKVIFDSHEFYDEQIAQKNYFPRWSRNVVRSLFIRYENYVLQRIDALILPCRFQGINPFEGRANITEFIANLPLLSELEYASDSIVTKGNYAICYVGGLTYSRGITHLVKAADNAGVNLILCGKFSSKSYQDDIESMVEYRCVDYRGFLNRKEVVKALEESNIGMCTLLNMGQYNQGDTLPTKVYEYMALGLPIIVSDYPYARAVLAKYNCGICVDPENINSITEAIKLLLNNPDVAKQMGENGREAVLGELNWSAEEKKLLELYDSIIDK